MYGIIKSCGGDSLSLFVLYKLRSMLTLQTPDYAVKISLNQWQQFIGGEPRDIRGELKTFGPWQIPVSYQALAISRVYPKDKSYPESITIYGNRTLSKTKESGYDLEGQVSIDGKKKRGFTSSVLFEVEGKLHEVAVIHVCEN